MVPAPLQGESYTIRLHFAMVCLLLFSRHTWDISGAVVLQQDRELTECLVIAFSKFLKLVQVFAIQQAACESSECGDARNDESHFLRAFFHLVLGLNHTFSQQLIPISASATEKLFSEFNQQTRPRTVVPHSDDTVA